MSKKQIPVFLTDEEAERLVQAADLTEFDLSQFKAANFEFEKKSAVEHATAATDAQATK